MGSGLVLWYYRFSYLEIHNAKPDPVSRGIRYIIDKIAKFAGVEGIHPHLFRHHVGFDMNQKDIEVAFDALNKSNFVIGPATDGGYYLLGMTKLKPALFQAKAWGTSSVLEQTLFDLQNETVDQLETKNDVDYYEDIKYEAAFQPFLKNIIKNEEIH